MASSDPGSSSDDQVASDDRYYCHTCNTEVDHVLSNFTCPLCGEGFLEQITNEFEEGAQDEHGDDFAQAEGGGFQQMFQHIFGGLLNHSQQGQQLAAGQPAAAGRDPRAGHGDILQMFLQELVQNLNANGAHIQFQITGDPRQHGGQAMFNFPALHGNPGDYAWGPGGLDQIVTQLLNQFEGGAPPLEKPDIEKIPKVAITAQNVANRMQCTTCMDDFYLDEIVLKLPCDHRFHSQCIIPWLERHNTCPICRKTVEGSSTKSVETSSTSESGGGGGGGGGGDGGAQGSTSTSMVDTIDELD